MLRPDPHPSDWLLHSRYGGDKILTTRTHRRIFAVRHVASVLTVTTTAGTTLGIDSIHLRSDWALLASDPTTAASKLSPSGSYVQAIYDDLHVPAREGDGRFSVYVIELDEGVWADPDMRSRNPDGDSSKPCVYVGYTSESVATRFQKHLSGKRFSKRVRHFGLRPLPQLYGAVNPLRDKPQALQAEADLTRALRGAGFRVWEGELGDLHIEAAGP